MDVVVVVVVVVYDYRGNIVTCHLLELRLPGQRAIKLVFLLCVMMEVIL